MVYAIEEMKIAAAGFAACGGTYGKGKREKAVLPPGGQAQGDVYALSLLHICKTTTCEHLGIGLAMEGKKVLLVDADPQGSLTISMGWQQPDELPTTLSTLMQKAMNDQSIPPGEGILHHAEGVDLIPANIELAGMEVSLVNCMNREKMLKQVLEGAKRDYDFILLDCTPSLGMLTVNALAAADTTLIPVQAQYLSAKGLEQLLQTVQKVRRQINPKLKIEGILLLSLIHI